MTDSNYRTYKDLSIDELEVVVQDLENMSILALKKGKKDFRKTILDTVIEAKKEIEKRKNEISSIDGTLAFYKELLQKDLQK